MEQQSLSQIMFDRLQGHLRLVLDKAIKRKDREAARDAERADALLYQFAGALDIERRREFLGEPASPPSVSSPGANSL